MNMVVSEMTGIIMLKLKEVWASNGIDVPTFTGDGPTTKMLEAGTLPGKCSRS